MAQTDEYMAIYKCRLCGKEFEYCRTGEIVAQALTVALSVNESTEHVRYNGKLRRHTVHECSDGSYGISDFRGFKKIEDSK